MYCSPLISLFRSLSNTLRAIHTEGTEGTEGHTDTGVVFGAFLGLVPVVGPGNTEVEQPSLLPRRYTSTEKGHHQTSDTSVLATLSMQMQTQL